MDRRGRSCFFLLFMLMRTMKTSLCVMYMEKGVKAMKYLWELNPISTKLTQDAT